jgi:tetratricopeptide (TPR) repeat protein
MSRCLVYDPGCPPITYADAYHNFARLLRASGSVGKAREHLEMALRLQPDFIQARRELDGLMETLRDTEKHLPK